MEDSTGAVADLTHRVRKATTILVVEEDGLPTVATAHHEVTGTCILNTRLPWHTHPVSKTPRPASYMSQCPAPYAPSHKKKNPLPVEEAGSDKESVAIEGLFPAAQQEQRDSSKAKKGNREWFWNDLHRNLTIF